LKTAIFVTWLAFGAYWLLASIGAKPGSTPRAPAVVRLLVLAFILARVLRGDALAVHSAALQIVGTVVFACGIGVAVWARIFLGRNWGMPMTQKDEPELVTRGPYAFVRNPIYTGILLALLGTSLATNLYWLIAFAISAAYFVRSARVEERVLASSFPVEYPPYRARTKMLIPFVL
jgi:protein-S-isoprenylcysteine O-methyltransferase Ste14